MKKQGYKVPVMYEGRRYMVDAGRVAGFTARMDRARYGVVRGRDAPTRSLVEGHMQSIDPNR